MGIDIIINLTASLIWFGLGYLAYSVLRFQRIIKPTKKLWNIHDHRNLIICAATSVRTDTGEYMRPATGIGQLRALGYSIESLSKAYDVKIQNILLSDDQVQRQIEKDIILLGGPKNNEITKLFLDKLSEKGQIANQEGSVIKWLVPNSEKNCTGTKKDRVVTNDYGLIIRMKNPFADSSKLTTVTIFSGCHTYGGIAAAKYFTGTYINEFKGFKNGKDNIALLVECDVVNGYPVAINKIKEHEF